MKTFRITKEHEFLNAVKDVIKQLERQEQKIADVVHILNDARANNRTVFICGNGGSAGTSIHLASDLFKMTGLKAISLNCNMPLTTAIVNDDGWENLYFKQLGVLFKAGDVLIVISVHGGTGMDKADLWSQNLLKAVDYAQENDGTVIGLSGCDGGEFNDMCDINIVVPSDSTPIIESMHCLLGHLITHIFKENGKTK